MDDRSRSPRQYPTPHGVSLSLEIRGLNLAPEEMLSGARRGYEVLRRRRMQENMQENTGPATRQWTLRPPPATAVSREMMERFGSWLRERPATLSPIPQTFLPSEGAGVLSSLSPWIPREAGLPDNATEEQYSQWVEELVDRIRGRDANPAQLRVWRFFEEVSRAEARLMAPIPIPQELMMEEQNSNDRLVDPGEEEDEGKGRGKGGGKGRKGKGKR